MVHQIRGFANFRSRLAALAAVALLSVGFTGSQAQSAVLAGVARQLERQLEFHQAHGGFVLIGGKHYRNGRALDRYGSRHFRFRYTEDFPYYRYMTFEEAGEGDDYYPPQPHYFSHRYNWYPPLATFRNADPLWYSW
jgi:hypothetical protein